MYQRPAAFALNEAFVVLLSSYLKNYGSRFLLIVPNNVSVSGPVSVYVESLGGSIITVSEINRIEKNNWPSHIWVHSFGGVPTAKSLIYHFGVGYSLYSDGLKNQLGKKGMEEYFPDYESVLFFGFMWVFPFLRKGVLFEICPFQDIILAFAAIKSIAGVELSFHSEDLKKDWVFLRRWGYGRGEFVRHLKYKDVIKRYLSEEGASALVLKGDPRIRTTSTDDVLTSLRDEFDVVSIEDRVEFTKYNSIVSDKYFAEVMLPGQICGNFHAFDSSLSVYASLVTNANIRFPSEEFLRKIFDDPGFARGVILYTSLYRNVCNYIKKLRDAQSFNVRSALVVEGREGGFVVSEDNSILSMSSDNRRGGKTVYEAGAVGAL